MHSCKLILHKREIKDSIHNFRLCLTDEGFRYDSTASKVFVNWSDVMYVVENKSSFLIFISVGKAYIVPKRDCADQDEISQFRDLVKQNLPGSKVKIKY